MIIVFGPVSMEQHMNLPQMPDGPSPVFNDDYRLNAGGKGANQALAAARTGAKVALVGKTGDDDFSKRILEKIRRDGVMTSGVARSEDLHTGLDILCKLPGNEIKIIKSRGANAEAAADQVPDEILNEDSYLLLQTELSATENTTLLERAKAQGVTTVLNLSPTLDLSPQMLENLDYLVVNSIEANKLAEQLNIPIKGNASKLAQALAQLGKLTCIVTEGKNGAVASAYEGKDYSIGAIPLEEVADHSGAEDAYCGTLTACLHEGMPLPDAMKCASIAGTITCTRAGGQKSLPYLAEIEEMLDQLDDAVEV